MPENQNAFEDLPVLDDLRRELTRAFAAHQTTAPSRRSPRHRRDREPRLPLLRRPVALIGSAAALASAAVAAVLLASPATQAAYALTQNANGTVTVTISDVESAAPALNAEFASMGIHERVVPVQANCPASSPSGIFGDPMFADPEATTGDTLTFSPGDRYLEPGYTGVIAAEQLADGQVAISMEAIDTPVPSCFPTTVYTMHRTGTTSNGTPAYRITPSDPAATTNSNTTGG